MFEQLLSERNGDSCAVQWRMRLFAKRFRERNDVEDLYQKQYYASTPHAYFFLIKGFQVDM